MMAPEGYVLFSELAEIAREIARDLCWAYRTEKGEGDDSITIRQVPLERSLVESWLITQFLFNEPFYVCSPLGVILRGDPLLSRHLDGLEVLRCPIPIEESSVKVPKVSPAFEPDEMIYFAKRFIFLDCTTGQVRNPSGLSEFKADVSGFSARAQAYFKQQYEDIVNGLRPYGGWSICIKEVDFRQEESELWEQFGVTEQVLDFVNKQSLAPVAVGRTNSVGRPRKRDQALDAYETLFPTGHESSGKTLKEATNDVSAELGVLISQDTLRRALGKKR